jgi:hypothetical protein
MKNRKLTYKELAEKYLDEEERIKFFKNIKSFMIDSECNNIDEKTFLATSFAWTDTTEGFSYWADLSFKILSL